MLLLVTLVLVVSAFVIVNASHFQGGTVSWQPTGNTNEVRLTFKMGWTYGRGPGCTEAKIGQLVSNGVGGSGWECTSGCGFPLYLAGVSYYCKGANSIEGWEQGENSFTHTFSGQGPFTVGYSDGDWSYLQGGKGGGSWNLETVIDLRQRSDTQRPNSSPVTLSKPIYYAQFGCEHTIRLPVFDPDGDKVRCRMAVGTECMSVCDALPGAVLDENTCTLTFRADASSYYVPGGWYGVAITIEDFPPSPITVGSVPYTTSNVLSSVPVQFLVQTPYSSQPCDSRPVFVDDTPLEGARIVVKVGDTLDLSLYATNTKNAAATITSVQVQAPRGMTQGAVTPDDKGRNNVFATKLTWTPTNADIGEHITCAIAEDSTRRSSESRCFSIFVKPQTPTVSGTSGLDDGDTTTLTCTTPLTDVTYEWYLNDVIISGATAMTYTTPAVTLSNYGDTYTCKVVKSSVKSDPSSNSVELTVKPQTPTVSGTSGLDDGDTTTLTCTTASTPLTDVTYEWYLNDVIISGATAMTYTTPAVTLSNYGDTYTCKVVKSSVKSDLSSNSVELTVKPQTPTVSGTSSVYDGDTTTLTCTTASTPLTDVTYEWYENDDVISDATAMTYTTAVGLSDNGDTFTCKAVLFQDTSDISSNSVELTVIPQTPTVNTTYSLTYGDTTTLTCLTASTPLTDVTYEWYQNDDVISDATSMTYTTAVGESDNGDTFTCKVVANGVASDISSNSVELKGQCIDAHTGTLTLIGREITRQNLEPCQQQVASFQCGTSKAVLEIRIGVGNAAQTVYPSDIVLEYSDNQDESATFRTSRNWLEKYQKDKSENPVKKASGAATLLAYVTYGTDQDGAPYLEFQSPDWSLRYDLSGLTATCVASPASLCVSNFERRVVSYRTSGKKQVPCSGLAGR